MYYLLYFDTEEPKDDIDEDKNQKQVTVYDSELFKTMTDNVVKKVIFIIYIALFNAISKCNNPLSITNDLITLKKREILFKEEEIKEKREKKARRQLAKATLKTNKKVTTPNFMENEEIPFIENSDSTTESTSSIQLSTSYNNLLTGDSNLLGSVTLGQQNKQTYLSTILESCLDFSLIKSDSDFITKIGALNALPKENLYTLITYIKPFILQENKHVVRVAIPIEELRNVMEIIINNTNTASIPNSNLNIVTEGETESDISKAVTKNVNDNNDEAISEMNSDISKNSNPEKSEKVENLIKDYTLDIIEQLDALQKNSISILQDYDVSRGTLDHVFMKVSGHKILDDKRNSKKSIVYTTISSILGKPIQNKYESSEIFMASSALENQTLINKNDSEDINSKLPMVADKPYKKNNKKPSQWHSSIAYLIKKSWIIEASGIPPGISIFLLCMFLGVLFTIGLMQLGRSIADMINDMLVTMYRYLMFTSAFKCCMRDAGHSDEDDTYDFMLPNDYINIIRTCVLDPDNVCNVPTYTTSLENDLRSFPNAMYYKNFFGMDSGSLVQKKTFEYSDDYIYDNENPLVYLTSTNNIPIGEDTKVPSANTTSAYIGVVSPYVNVKSTHKLFFDTNEDSLWNSIDVSSNTIPMINNKYYSWEKGLPHYALYTDKGDADTEAYNKLFYNENFFGYTASNKKLDNLLRKFPPPMTFIELDPAKYEGMDELRFIQENTDFKHGRTWLYDLKEEDYLNRYNIVKNVPEPKVSKVAKDPNHRVLYPNPVESLYKIKTEAQSEKDVLENDPGIFPFFAIGNSGISPKQGTYFADEYYQCQYTCRNYFVNSKRFEYKQKNKFPPPKFMIEKWRSECYSTVCDVKYKEYLENLFTENSELMNGHSDPEYHLYQPFFQIGDGFITLPSPDDFDKLSVRFQSDASLKFGLREYKPKWSNSYTEKTKTAINNNFPMAVFDFYDTPVEYQDPGYHDRNLPGSHFYHEKKMKINFEPLSITKDKDGKLKQTGGMAFRVIAPMGYRVPTFECYPKTLSIQSLSRGTTINPSNGKLTVDSSNISFNSPNHNLFYFDFFLDTILFTTVPGRAKNDPAGSLLMGPVSKLTGALLRKQYVLNKINNGENVTLKDAYEGIKFHTEFIEQPYYHSFTWKKLGRNIYKQTERVIMSLLSIILCFAPVVVAIYKMSKEMDSGVLRLLHLHGVSKRKWLIANFLHYSIWSLVPSTIIVIVLMIYRGDLFMRLDEKEDNFIALLKSMPILYLYLTPIVGIASGCLMIFIAGNSAMVVTFFILILVLVLDVLVTFDTSVLCAVGIILPILPISSILSADMTLFMVKETTMEKDNACIATSIVCSAFHIVLALILASITDFKTMIKHRKELRAKNQIKKVEELHTIDIENDDIDVENNSNGEEINTTNRGNLLNDKDEDAIDIEEGSTHSMTIANNCDKEKVILNIENAKHIYPTGNCAVDNISFKLNRGETLALAGSNGSGKSTTLNGLTGLLIFTGGHAWFNGKNGKTVDLFTQSNNSDYISIVPQMDIYFPELSIRKHLQLIAGLENARKYKALKKSLAEYKKQKKAKKTIYNDLDKIILLPHKEDIQKSVHFFDDNDVNKIITAMDLEKEADIQAGKLSGGSLRKLSIAMAALPQPPILSLDEITTSLGVAKHQIFDTLNKLGRGNNEFGEQSRILTTHDMLEIEALADKCVIMVNGKIALSGSVSQIRKNSRVKFTLNLELGSKSVDTMNQLLKDNNEISHYVESGPIINKTGRVVSYNFNNSSDLKTIIKLLNKKNVLNEKWIVEFNRFEQVFLETIGTISE